MSSQKAWQITPRISQEATQRLAPFSPLAAQLLHNRGITNQDEAETFLARDERLLNDPLLLPDMGKAIARLRKALRDGETIGIFGDFDADGVTGTALLAEGLEAMGGKVIPYLPHRVREGHGLGSQAIRGLREQGATLLVTVDCGIASPREVEEASAFGMDTIVTDHHVPPPEVPAALAVVNPRLAGACYPFPDLAGAGLAFKLVQGLSQDIGRPWDERLLQLAAVGTVTDVTPLVGENRYIVSEGLRSMGANPKPGLRELLRLGGMADAAVDTEVVSFVLGPRLNGSGRLDDAISSYNLLRASSQEEALPWAAELERLNRERQTLTERALEDARRQLGGGPPAEPLVLLWSKDFIPGIVGLVASRLVEEHYRPSVVVALDGDLGWGSARSIPEFNLASALEECRDLFIRHGGHPRAAGFTIAQENLNALRERLSGIARREIGHLFLQPTINIDAHVRLTTLMGENLRFFQELAPYGERNPTPIFLTRGVEVVESTQMGAQGQHLSLKVRYDGALWDAVAFNQGNGWNRESGLLDVVYNVGIDRWNGRERMRLVIRDFRPTARP